MSAETERRARNRAETGVITERVQRVVPAGRYPWLVRCGDHVLAFRYRSDADHVCSGFYGLIDLEGRDYIIRETA